VATASRTRIRLSREARREQLLDAAAQLLIERGATAVTMERVAEWAGVSKALPYSHFDNSDDVLVALYQRVVGALGQRVLDALHDPGSDDDRIALVVRVYLDAVAEQGPILRAVTTPGSRTSELADGERRVGPRFVARMLRDHFDLDEQRAKAVAPVLLAGLTGAVSAWADRVATRAQAEDMAVRVMRTLVEG
jgi:AcrR family transcriptional regulator